MEQRTMTVSFHPLGGSYALQGAMLDKWEELGGGEGMLGFPVASKACHTTDGSTMRFQRGLLAAHAECGAHPVAGKIRLWWEDHLSVYGPYGYPTSDPYERDGATVQEFQGGMLGTDMDELKNSVDLRGEIARREIGVRDQGKRGTCSVQVMVFLLEYLYSGLLGRDYRHLSVEYSNHFANVATGTRDDGHCFSSMEAGYEQYGIVPESLWPYNREWAYDYCQAQKITDADMISRGRLLLGDGLRLKGRFIKPLDGEPGLTRMQFEEMIALLDRGIPVGVGRSHSLAAVGYRRDESQPGSGVVLFRNSYGTTPDFTGYQAQAFDHVMRTVNDIYVYTL